jgi:hypothetical protein
MSSVSTPPLTAHKSALRRPTPAFRVAISVAEACEELWSVQDASQAQPWLRMLHAALLRDRVDAYDPSEAFLCIQGAALNLPETWEHALWAAGALARACVGPAWCLQRLGEPPTNSSTVTTLSESTVESGSSRHQSPRSYSPILADLQQQQSYPYIPEVLPGAILRFAANAPMESRSLAEAQRELVLALCCCFDSFDQQHRPPEWTIPGAHDPVETMMRFWLESTAATVLTTSDNVSEETQDQQTYPIKFKADESVTELVDRLGRRSMDWWYTLHAARACSDLVSVGWRPHQDNAVIILHLLDIAQQGISLRHMSPTATNQEAREERLAATSSAAEAISALASLGSRGLLPSTCQAETVAQLVQLQVVAGKSAEYVHSLYPLGTPQSADEEHEWQQERETFLSQRASCFGDTADLLWALLARESSSVLVMATLLADTKDDLQRAPVVVRIVSGALWGKPPNLPGIPTLRIYWKEFLTLLQKLAMQFVESASTDKEQKQSVSRQSMTLALEVVVAVGRLVKTEMIRGRGILASDEWDSFLKMLGSVIIPCLQLNGDKVASLYHPEDERALRKPQKILQRIQTECETVLLNLGEYLDKCSRFETYHYHLIGNDKWRDALHFRLLREAVPLMSKGTSLAVKVLRSWAAVGFLPDRKETWGETAAAIVADAFAVHENWPMSRYGGYVHSPIVRLEALVLLSSDGACCSTSGSDGQTNDTTRTSHRAGAGQTSDTIRTSHTAGARSSVLSLMSLTSPLCSTKHVHDDYCHLVRASILPSLSLVFNRAISDDGLGKVLQYSNTSRVRIVAVDSDLRQLLSEGSASETDEHQNESFKLRKYSIDLVGRLFCSDIATIECRSRLVDTLMDASLMESFGCPLAPGNDRMPTLEPERFSNEITIRCLEAIGQIETCLCAPFFSITHAHESLPGLVHALCSILNHFAGYRCDENQELIQNKQQEYSFRLLSFAALLPLARLRRSFDGGLLLVEREEAMSHFPDEIIALLSERQRDVVDDEGPFVAPFARVDTRHQSRDPSASTLVSFEPIVKTLLGILRTPWYTGTATGEEGHSRERIKDLENRFRSSCYDALLSYVVSGLSFPTLHLVGMLVNFPKTEGSYCSTENFTRLRATLAAFEGTVQVTQEPLNGEIAIPAVAFQWTEIHLLVDQLIQLCRSRRPEEVISGCKLLIGLFPSITGCRSEGKESFQELHRGIFASLISSTRDCLDQTDADDSPEVYFSRAKEREGAKLDRGPPLLLLLYQCSVYYMELIAGIESDEAKDVLSLCYDVACSFRTSRSCRTLAVRCAVSVLDRLDGKDVEDLMDEYSRNYDDDLSMGGISAASQLEVPESDLILCAISHKAMKFKNDYTQLIEDDNEKGHFALATEFADIKAFDKSKDCAAAWLCGDHLLTCKIGGTKSKNCGWVELTIRGATFRRRELVRLSSSVSVAKPELPSSLWSDPGNLGTDEAMGYYSLESPTLQGDEVAMKNALDLLKRCDRLLGTEDDAGVESSKQRHPNHPEGISRSPSPRYPASDDSFHDSFHSTPTVYTQDDALYPRIPSQIEVANPSSIRAWLWEALNDPLQVEDVAKRLSAIGLDSILDHASSGGEANRNDSGMVDLLPVIRLRMDEKAARGINLLDRAVALDTHKIALLFASPPDARNQNDEDEVDFLLKVQSASPTFFDFAGGLGDLVMSRHLKYFSAGFDTSGADTDGKYALVWIENSDVGHIASSFLTIYHTVAYMPQNVINRKRHVGNDSVHIVFCDPASVLHEQLWAGGMEEEMESILVSGEFGFVTIFVMPGSKGSCRVKVQLRPGLPENTSLQLHHLPGEHIISTTEAPKFVRRLANLADIACSALMHDTLGPPTSWEIRLRQLRLMRRHAMN